MLLLIVATVLTTLFTISSETPLDLSEDKRNAVLRDIEDKPVIRINSPLSLGMEDALGIRENLAAENFPGNGVRFQYRALDNEPWKRACRFNLGGHCLTEEMNRAAEIYYYLKSPDSPGRRRRSAGWRSSKDIGDLLR